MKKFLVIMLAMLWMSVAAFSQITISQEDYDKLPSDTRTQIEKITTEKAIKGEIKEVSEYANLGKEIGVAVNETLKAVEDSAIRIADSNLGQTRIAQAKQKQEAETQKAINEQEAAVAKYESDKRVKAAEADKIAGVAE